MSGHTPGPWRWWTSCSFDRLSSDATGKDGDVLHAVRYSDGVCGIEGSEEDKRLIAAAPELLEALRPIAERGEISASIIRKARAAIDKATGKQP